jgi:hypothetical protein
VARWSRWSFAAMSPLEFHDVVLSSVDPGCSHLRHNRPSSSGVNGGGEAPYLRLICTSSSSFAAKSSSHSVSSLRVIHAASRRFPGPLSSTMNHHSRASRPCLTESTARRLGAISCARWLLTTCSIALGLGTGCFSAS